ncbi:MAG: alanine racemase [Candidatus Paceibacterota bacterium]|jgi:alanine racemase
MFQSLTWVEISKEAINYNIRQFRKLIGKNTLLMPVIKSNAYGHGLLEMAQICNNNLEVNRICVVNLDEAIDLINHKITKPIFILSFYNFNQDKLKLAIQNNVIFSVYELEQAKSLNKITSQLGRDVKIHLEIDTGASRTGILPEQTLLFIKQLKNYPRLILEGVWSHFASSEENPKYTNYQLMRFEQVIHTLDKAKIQIPLKHMACSAGSVLYPQSIFNAIRLGLSLYGLYPAPKTQNKIKLQPVLSWYTTIIQVREVPTKTKIGYGGTYTTKRRTKLAIIPIGYWDGYDRSLSNKASVIIHNKKCPVRGRICMNLTMVDVTGIRDVKLGEKVILIGKSKSQKITVEDLAKWQNTINDETITRINPLAERRVI